VCDAQKTRIDASLGTIVTQQENRGERTCMHVEETWREKTGDDGLVAQK
jgi:hypothetical protein